MVGTGDPERPRNASEWPSGLVGARFGRPAGGLLLSRNDDGCRIVVLGRADEALLSLGAFSEEEVVATWRSLAAASGLSLVLARPDGDLDRPYPQIGRLTLGPPQPRRRHVGLGRRRPRFLVRRKVTRLPPRPLVYRDREIACGRNA